MIHTHQSTRTSNTLQNWHSRSTQVPEGLDCIKHQLIEQILAFPKLWVSCLKLKFGRAENLLGVITQYEILGCYRLG
jgi:hypothetical protein